MGSVVGHVAQEIPKYELIEHRSGYEIRQYPPRVVVCTQSDQTAEGESAAFRRLANYIGVFSTPRNLAVRTNQDDASAGSAIGSQSIAMTAPVMSTYAQSSQTMSFFLPSQYRTMESAPHPTDPSVKLQIIPAQRIAVLAFTGAATPAVVASMLERFRQGLQQDEIRPARDSWALMRFNPPWTIPFLRKNELHVEVLG
eukprot:c26230_g1_i1.p1 GENE.c26230_g1_i1~~c26230_g1_i1.p1  ORF type:complete len:232 (-),score=42.91 c26230_g1_i1:507-1100(-)